MYDQRRIVAGRALKGNERQQYYPARKIVQVGSEIERGPVRVLVVWLAESLLRLPLRAGHTFRRSQQVSGQN
jgi:hypothetical protein